MKKSLSCLFVFSLVLLASVFLLSSNVFAVTPPYFTSAGQFNYDVDTNKLSINISSLGLLYYADGTIGVGSTSPTADPLVKNPRGWFELGADDPTNPLGTHTSNIFNGGANGNQFGPSVGNTGLFDFRLYDYLGNTRLTASVNNFTVIQNGSLWEVNVGFDLNNMVNIATNPNGGTGTPPYSKFINDINSFGSNRSGNLYMKFDFGLNPTGFTADTYGSVSSTVSFAPEPVSSILFVTGGAALAFRRYLRKRNQQIS